MKTYYLEKMYHYDKTFCLMQIYHYHESNHSDKIYPCAENPSLLWRFLYWCGLNTVMEIVKAEAEIRAELGISNSSSRQTLFFGDHLDIKSLWGNHQ